LSGISCREIYFVKATRPRQIDFLIDEVKSAVREVGVPPEYDIRVYKNVYACCGVGGLSIIIEVVGSEEEKIRVIDKRALSKIIEFCEKEGYEVEHTFEQFEIIPPQITEGTRGYINAHLQRSEQIWWVLFRLFGDLVRKDVKVDPEYARELRNCRTLIDFVRSHLCPECDIRLANERLPDLYNSLEKVKRDLIATAIGVSGDYTQEWISEIDKAERGELREIPVAGPSFVPGLPRNSNIGWTRITLWKPVPKERVEEISRMLGVALKAESSLQFVVRGEKEKVKKAVEMLYQLSS